MNGKSFFVCVQKVKNYKFPCPSHFNILQGLHYSRWKWWWHINIKIFLLIFIASTIFIPVQKNTKYQIRGRQVSVIIDGTTQLCKSLVIILWFVNEKWNLQQHIVQVMLLAKSSSEELAQ